MKQIEQLVKKIAHIKGFAISREQAIERGLNGYIEVEYNSHYGGYRIVMVRVQGGGHFGALGESPSCRRRSKGVMTAFLEGYINALQS